MLSVANELFRLSVIMLCVVMLNVVMLSVVMLSVIMLNVVMLNVAAPKRLSGNKHYSLFLWNANAL